MSRDIILFIQDVKGLLRHGVDQMAAEIGYELRPMMLIDTSSGTHFASNQVPEGFEVLEVDFSDHAALSEAIDSLRDSILLVTCRTEASMEAYVQIMEHLPDLPAPSRLSVETAISKTKTREVMQAKAPQYSPKFMEVTNNDDSTLDQLEATVGYPCVAKPTGLDSSLLVQACRNREELSVAIAKIEEKIRELYQTMTGRGHAATVVEEMIVGDMYSVDVFVTPAGGKHFCPLVRVVTGAEVGLDDYFGYIRRAPVDLPEADVAAAQQAAADSIDAIGLAATTCHVELFKTEAGWKLIEIGPRTGGYRDQMHTYSQGIDYAFSDLAVRTNQIAPRAEPQKQGFTAVINSYPAKEGALVSSVDEVTITNLQSYIKHQLRYKAGDTVAPAKFGGKPILSVTLAHEDQSVVEDDLATVQKATPTEVK